MFLLATHVGALKARYEQWWSPVFAAFQRTGLTAFVLPFVLPYYRATIYSGDRIAYACTADLDTSLQAVFRALVGDHVAPYLRPDGLLGQALTVRRRPVLRIAQLLRPAPHATDRYLQLLAFVRRNTPNTYATIKPALAEQAATTEPLLDRMGRARPVPAAPAVAIALSVLVLIAGFVAGFTFRDALLAQLLTGAGPAPQTEQPGSPDRGGGPDDPTALGPPTGTAQIQLEAGGVDYDIVLSLDGENGTADVSYRVLGTGDRGAVTQTLEYQAGVDESYYLGSDPRDLQTGLPAGTFIPDLFVLENDSGGWRLSAVCDSSSISCITVDAPLGSL